MAKRSMDKQRRRKVAQVRSDILVAAQSIFAEKGYSATSMREVAQRSKTSNPVLFRHFETKAKLFAAAVFEPIEKILDDTFINPGLYYSDALSPIDRLRNYATLMIDVFRQNRRLLLAYHNALSFHAEEFEGVHGANLLPTSFEQRLKRLERQPRELSAGKRFLISDYHYEVRLIVLFFYAVAVFDDMFFAQAERGSEQEINSLVKLVSVGTGLGGSPDRSAAYGENGTASERETKLAKENETLRTLLIDALVKNQEDGRR